MHPDYIQIPLHKDQFPTATNRLQALVKTVENLAFTVVWGLRAIQILRLIFATNDPTPKADTTSSSIPDGKDQPVAKAVVTTFLLFCHFD